MKRLSMEEIAMYYPASDRCVKEISLERYDRLCKELKADFIMQTNKHNEKYIDIYVYNPLVMKTDQPLRFILQKDVKMPKEMEYCFYEVMTRFKVVMDFYELNKLGDALKELYSVIISEYDSASADSCLVNIYHRLTAGDNAF